MTTFVKEKTSFVVIHDKLYQHDCVVYVMNFLHRHFPRPSDFFIFTSLKKRLKEIWLK